MNAEKTRSIKNIEQRMEEMSPESLRYKVLENAKDFKTSWIELGQILSTVWKDKMYKEWGYSEFDAYTSKEIGIRKQTALKLLRSYSFLEREEPRYLSKGHNEEISAQQVPTYEAVDVLRRASSNKDIDKDDYAKIKKYVLTDGKDARQAQKDLTNMIKKNEELDPQETHQKKSMARVKRFVSLLKSIKKEVRTEKTLPAKIADEADRLISMIEAEMPQGG